MAELIARVNEEEGKIEGGLVELSSGEITVKGRVAAVSENEFLVDWEDGARSVENKSDYELVVATKTASPICQSAGCNGVANEYGVCSVHSVIPAATTVPLAVEERAKTSPSQSFTGVPAEIAERARTSPAVSFASVHTAEENPAQPAGWAVPPVDADAYPGGELMALEMEKRQETAEWEDAQNRAPIDGENPAQPGGFAVPPASGEPIPGQGADGLMMAARVTADDITGENGEVELVNGNLRVAGRVIASDDDSFIVEWEDERRTVENKADYDLVITAKDQDAVTCEKCGAPKYEGPKGMLCRNCDGSH